MKWVAWTVIGTKGEKLSRRAAVRERAGMAVGKLAFPGRSSARE